MNSIMSPVTVPVIVVLPNVIKYGITQNLTADLTYNTDFAQVEVDEQQVNLTRFSLFFPEKREFFLEGQGIFDFARGGGPSTRDSALRQIGSRGRGNSGGGNAPTLFYSRRIGLEDGAIVPIVGGGRVTGKIGAFDVGLLNIQTDEEVVSGAEPTNFTVVRLKRDILRRSSIGAIFTNRSVSLIGDGASQTYGVDGTFSFYDNVSLLTYVARTQTPGLEVDDTSYQGQFTYVETGTGCRRNTWSSRTTSSRRSASSAATIFAARMAPRDSVHARNRSTPSDSSASGGASTTS